MSNITMDDVQRLAVLSNLALTSDEIASLTDDIAGILTYIEQLSDIDTDGVEPTYQVTSLENVWRQDVVMNSEVTGNELVSLSEDTIENQVRVPKVL